MWFARWTTLLGVAVQRTVAAFLIREGGFKFPDAVDAIEPHSVDVWLDRASF